jgi:Ricin-type beta-trefoil lectin domain-like
MRGTSPSVNIPSKCYSVRKEKWTKYYGDAKGRRKQRRITMPNPAIGIYHAEHSDKVLDVEGASQNNLAAIIQFERHGGPNQRFRIEDVGDGLVRLVAVHSNLVLDVAGASQDNRAAIIQWSWNGGDHQKWRIEDSA